LSHSVLLHAAIFGLAYWLMREAQRREQAIPPSRAPGPINVDIVGGKGGPSNGKGASQKHASRPKKAPPPLQLGPSFRFTPGGGSPQPPGAGGGGGGGAGPADGYDVANAMGLEEEGKLYPFFHAIWKKVDSATGYPDDFVRERIKGFVTAQVVVNRQGVFTGKIVEINSDQPFLETYVMAILFHALSEPLPPETWSHRDEMILVLSFDFHVFSYGESPPPRMEEKIKNVLSFSRYGYDDPKLNHVVEKILTHYMPPIIPIPGGFFIDFFHAYQFVQNLRNHRMEEDDLRLQRIELRQDQWRSVVRKAPDGRAAE
jgi:hypothetical protein